MKLNGGIVPFKHHFRLFFSIHSLSPTLCGSCYLQLYGDVVHRDTTINFHNLQPFIIIMSEAPTLKRKQGPEDASDAKKLRLDDRSAVKSGEENITPESTNKVENPRIESKDPANDSGETQKDNETTNTSSKNSTEPSPKPVFGATSTFGNASIFDKMKSKTNVFDGLPLKSPEKAATATSFGSSFGSSFGLFGANSKFANALQRATEKKSFLDEPETDNTESKSPPETPRATQQYKQVELVAQEVKTGEENEHSLYSATAKLFELDLTRIKEGWKERGLGPLHLNQSLDDVSQVRIVMRSQGLLRVILNYRITPTTVLIKGLEASLAPGKYLRFNSVSPEGKPVQYLIKFSNETLRNELVDKVNEVRAATAKNNTRLDTNNSASAPSTQEATDEDTGDEN